jgi:hypothetical protein
MKRFWIDCGDEFPGEEFIKYLKSEGIEVNTSE